MPVRRKVKANRHVPWIMGIGSLAIGVWFWFQLGVGQFILGTLLVFFGWDSIKLARKASDEELAELTGENMPDHIKNKFKDRLLK